MHNLLEITESADKLEDLVYGEPDAQIQRRYHMLLLLKTGEAESRSAAARRLGVHRNTIASWLGLYEEARSGRVPHRIQVSSGCCNCIAINCNWYKTMLKWTLIAEYSNR